MTTVLFVFWLLIALTFAIAFTIAVGCWWDEHNKTKWLEAELARQTDPAHQLAVIRELGEAGRREVQRLADEVQDVLGTAHGGRQ